MEQAGAPFLKKQPVGGFFKEAFFFLTRNGFFKKAPKNGFFNFKKTYGLLQSRRAPVREAFFLGKKKTKKTKKTEKNKKCFFKEGSSFFKIGCFYKPCNVCTRVAATKRSRRRRKTNPTPPSPGHFAVLNQKGASFFLGKGKKWRYWVPRRRPAFFLFFFLFY
jgi:hypothetical protein